jgi:DNA-directed RNA polymerase subunit RPC12/RpoP
MMDLIEPYYQYIKVFGPILVVLYFYINFKRKITTELVCPKCKSTKSERLKRGEFFKNLQMMNMSDLKKYRCLNCYRIFYQSKRR